MPNSHDETRHDLSFGDGLGSDGWAGADRHDIPPLGDPDNIETIELNPGAEARVFLGSLVAEYEDDELLGPSDSLPGAPATPVDEELEVVTVPSNPAKASEAKGWAKFFKRNPAKSAAAIKYEQALQEEQERLRKEAEEARRQQERELERAERIRRERLQQGADDVVTRAELELAMSQVRQQPEIDEKLIDQIIERVRHRQDLPEALSDMQRQFVELIGNYREGAIDRTALEDQLASLSAIHEGVRWMIGAQSGKWYYWDEDLATWIASEPPISVEDLAEIGEASLPTADDGTSDELGEIFSQGVQEVDVEEAAAEDGKLGDPDDEVIIADDLTDIEEPLRAEEAPLGDLPHGDPVDESGRAEEAVVEANLGRESVGGDETDPYAGTLEADEEAFVEPEAAEEGDAGTGDAEDADTSEAEEIEHGEELSLAGEADASAVVVEVPDTFEPAEVEGLDAALEDVEPAADDHTSEHVETGDGDTDDLVEETVVITALHPSFQQAYNAYRKVLRAYAAGKLDHEEAVRRVAGLSVLHDGGRWVLGAQTGQWYRVVGKEFIPANPPTVPIQGKRRRRRVKAA